MLSRLLVSLFTVAALLGGPAFSVADEAAQMSSPTAPSTVTPPPVASPTIASLPTASSPAVPPPAPPLRVLIDVRTTHSDGAHSMQTLVDMAKARGIQAMAFVDHGRKGIRFGIEPVMHFLGYTKDLRSLYTTGLPPFFADLNRTRRANPDMILFGGAESIAGYHWTGFPFRDLTLHNSERMFITLGEEKPEEISKLPSFSLQNAHGPFKFSMLFWCVLVGGVLFWLIRRRKRAVAMLLFVSFIAFLASWLLRPHVDEDADFIAKAGKEGLFTIWAYPGTLSGVRRGPMGVQLDTPPYSRRVFHDPTADAFAAIYGDTDENTVPGGLWDHYMADYMTGLHPHPIWAVAAGDFHRQGQAGEVLGNFPMDVWSEVHTPAGIIKAMRDGHSVAWRERGGQNFRLGALYLDAAGKQMLPGDESVVPADVELHMTLHGWPQARPAQLTRPVRARLIVDGKVAKHLTLFLDAPLSEPLHLESGAHVVRVDIPHQWLGAMIANPFLLRVR